MSFLNRFFGSAETKYQILADKLGFHEGLAKNNLHATHPHLQSILQKHQLNPESLRSQGNDLSPTTTFGALLALPNLLTGQKSEPQNEGDDL